MTKILILGAAGQIARVTTGLFLETTNLELVLFARNARRLDGLANNDRITIIDGDVMDGVKLEAAMDGVDVVYANLSGNMAAQARTIIMAMHNAKIKRLIFISSMASMTKYQGKAIPVCSILIETLHSQLKHLTLTIRSFVPNGSITVMKSPMAPRSRASLSRPRKPMFRARALVI